MKCWTVDRLRVKPTIPRCLNLPPLGTVEALSPQGQTSCKACVHTSAEQIRKCMKRTQTSNATYFLSFGMSVKLVNSRRPSDSEFHLKLFLEIFRHVSIKRCIIVRRAIGIQVFIFNFWMSDNLQVKTMFWLSISPQALFPKMSDTLRTGSVL
jgi:hypothetical protein